MDINTYALPAGAVTRIGRGKARYTAFSQDGSRLAVRSSLGLWLYDVSTTDTLAFWERKGAIVCAISFSPDDTLLATGTTAGDIKLLDLRNQDCIAEMRLGGKFNWAHQVSFSPDGQRLAASGGHYGAYVWNINTGEVVAEFTNENAPIKIPRPLIPHAFSPNGKLLVSATPDNTFSAWDIEASERIALFTGHTAPVVAVIFSPCGRFLISADRNGVLHEWDFNVGITDGQNSCFSVLPTNAKSRLKLVYSTDGTLLAAGMNDSPPTVTVWDVRHNKKLKISGSEQRPQRIGFSPIGSQLAIIGRDKIQTCHIGESNPCGTSVFEHSSPCGVVQFSPDGNTLAAGYWSGAIKLWNVEGLELQPTFRGDALSVVRSIDFSPCGTKLAASSYDKNVRIWDFGQPDASPVKLAGHQSVLYAVAFSPKGDLLVSADSKGVLGVWDAQQDYELKLFTEETDWIWSIAFSPDGKRLVSGHSRKNAQVWDIEEGKSITELSLDLPQDRTKYRGDADGIQIFLNGLETDIQLSDIPMAIAFSPDGTLIAGGVLREIRLWDAATYETLMVICQPVGSQRPAALTFSPCGRYLAAGAWWQGTDKMSIRLWDVVTCENIATFWGHTTDIQSLAFSPDATLLASSSYDGTILLWDTKPYLQ